MTGMFKRRASRVLAASVLVVAIPWFLAGCSKSDKYKDAFMSQCAIVKAMKDACSCTYDRMTAEVSMEAIAMSLEGSKQDPAVAKAITSALATCTAKYR